MGSVASVRSFAALQGGGYPAGDDKALYIATSARSWNQLWACV